MTTTFFDTLAADHIHNLPVYKPGKPIEALERELGITGALKIASNENPIGPSPHAVEALRAVATELHRYPDGGAYNLRYTLAEYHGIGPDQLLFGAGSNEIIHMLVHALCRPGHDQIVTHAHAFISYQLAAMSLGIESIITPTTEALACDVDALIAALGPTTKLVFLANPNNPTGSYVGRADFERLLAAVPEQALLVVDEAYHEHAIASAEDYPRSQDYHASYGPRLVTLRTFSKIHGLAGLRVGYAMGNPRVLGLLNRIRRPFNINAAAQAAAVAALADADHVQRSREVARAGIEAITAVVSAAGLRAYPSLGNFVLVKIGERSKDVYQALLHEGLIVRAMSGPWGLPEHLRISAPPPDAIERVTTTLGEVLAR